MSFFLTHCLISIFIDTLDDIALDIILHFLTLAFDNLLSDTSRYAIDRCKTTKDRRKLEKSFKSIIQKNLRSMSISDLALKALSGNDSPILKQMFADIISSEGGHKETMVGILSSLYSGEQLESLKEELPRITEDFRAIVWEDPTISEVLKNEMIQRYVHQTLIDHEARITCLEERANQEYKEWLVSSSPRPSPYFIGRSDELKLIDDLLEKFGAVVITGMAGIGKTEICKKYAQLYQPLHGYTVVWVTYYDNIKSTLASAITPDNSSTDGSTESAFANAVKCISRESNPLVIIDNYTGTDLDLIVGCQFKILVSSRNRAIPLIERIDLDSLSQVDSLALLQSMISKERQSWFVKNQEAIGSLLNNMRYHTLSIVLIAGLINESLLLSENLTDGLLDISKIQIPLDKDGKYQENSMEDHIRHLFQLNKCDDHDLKMLSFLSMLPRNGFDK